MMSEIMIGILVTAALGPALVAVWIAVYHICFGGKR